MMAKGDEAHSRNPSIQGLVALLCLTLGVALSWAVLDLPSSASDLTGNVQANMARSGVSHWVTAVLLNFRGYDTLLEIGVLVLAVFCVWSLPRPPASLTPPHETSAEPVLSTLVRLIVPFMAVVAGYLLWLGGHAPGGAFQAGAVLGAAWVLLLLSGLYPLARLGGWPLRSIVVLGFGLFLAVAVGVMLSGGHLLEYPRHWAKELILLIEATLTLSIAFILAALFVGSPPEKPSDINPARSPDGQ